jgi:hypothetical protein
MYCRNCGKRTIERNLFCSACGQEQRRESSSESTAPPLMGSNAPETAEGASPSMKNLENEDPKVADHQSNFSAFSKPVHRSGTGTGGEKRPPNSQVEAKGFFASLFDFGFTSFITLKFLSVIYGVVVVLILVTSVILFVTGISQGGTFAVLAIVVIPIVALLYLVLTRVSLEIVALFFRIGENTSLMVAAGNHSDLISAGTTEER